MKKIKICSLLFVFALMFLSPSISARELSAKSHGMGGAFISNVSGSQASYYNPAMLSQNDGTFGIDINAGVVNFALEDTEFFDDLTEMIEEHENFNSFEDIKNYNLEGEEYLNVDAMTNVSFKNFANFAVGANLYNEFSYIGEGEIPDLENLNYEEYEKEVLEEYEEEILSGEYTEEEIEEKIKEYIYDDIDDFDYKVDNEMLLEARGSLSTDLDFLPIPLTDISVGANIKHLEGRNDVYGVSKNEIDKDDIDEDITGDDLFEMAEYQEEILGDGTAFDVGFLTGVLNNRVNIAGVYQNVYNDFEWEGDIDSNLSALEENIKLGVSGDVPFPISANVAAEIETDTNFYSEEMIYKLGVNRPIIFGLLDLRAGAYQQGLEEDGRVYTGGLGVNLPFVATNISVDSEQSARFSAEFNF